MNWITTNIRLPEDIYMEFKMQAARERKSIAAIMREKLVPKQKQSEKRTRILMKEFNRVAKANAHVMKGKSLSKLLIDMRYEQ